MSFWNSVLQRVGWGLLLLVAVLVLNFALISVAPGDIADTIIESINKIGSLINGPLLAVFLMGMLSRRINGPGATSGLIIGFAVNLFLWKYAPKISWLWWNAIGFLVTYA